MTERRTCIRCGRAIDAVARICPYCNWDQTAPVPAATEPSAAAAYVPPPDNRVRNRLLGIAALVGLVIIAFVVGALLHGSDNDAVKTAANTTTQLQTPAGPVSHKSDVTLVPVTDSNPAPVIEQPITSAPAQTPGQSPNDATALPSDQYAAIAAQARTQKRAATTSIDPRTLQGRAYEPGAPPTRTVPGDERRERANPPMASSSVIRTAAFPEYKPLPNLHLGGDTSAKLALTVGADGRVRDIEVIEPIPGATPQLIAAVQSWRFRPATENGVPVSAKVNVTINLRGNE